MVNGVNFGSSHLMTWRTTLLTWKWPGCLDVLAPLLSYCRACVFIWSNTSCTNSSLSRRSCCNSVD